MKPITMNSHPSAFLEDLIDACVMECYFHEHMAELNLRFLDRLPTAIPDLFSVILEEEKV